MAKNAPGDTPTPTVNATPKVVARRSRKSAPKSVTERAQDRYADVILDGAPVPSLRTLMAALHLGRDKARQARAHLVTLAPMNGHAPA